MRLTTLTLLWALSAQAQQADSPYYLRSSEQPHFKNDNNGRNDMERIDDNVRQINGLVGELAALKREVEALKQRIGALEEASTKK